MRDRKTLEEIIGAVARDPEVEALRLGHIEMEILLDLRDQNAEIIKLLQKKRYCPNCKGTGFVLFMRNGQEEKKPCESKNHD